MSVIRARKHKHRGNRGTVGGDGAGGRPDPGFLTDPILRLSRPSYHRPGMHDRLTGNDRTLQPLTDNQQCVLEVLSADVPMTPVEVAVASGVKRNSAYSALMGLAAKDLAVRRDGCWRLAEPG